jgi:L-cystine uptake protein TcyP (sodium:dicarboxylate symporter family)
VSTGAASERDASIDTLPASPAPAADTAPEGENVLEAWWLWTIVGVVVLSGVGVGVGVAATTPAATAPGDVGGVVVTLGGAW